MHNMVATRRVATLSK